MNLKLLKYNVMVRKIKFRGKDIDTEEWRYGYLSSLHFVMNKSLIQAAYEILCWYMEKEYLKLIKPYVVNES